jgi:hypothetical protein
MRIPSAFEVLAAARGVGAEIRLVGAADSAGRRSVALLGNEGALFPRAAKSKAFTFHGTPVKSDVIFKEGLRPNGTNTDILAHARNSKAPPSAFVSTSKSAEVTAWNGENIYVIRPRNGIDVNQVLGPRSPFCDELEIAILGGVRRSDIRAVTLPNEGVSILNPTWRR